MEALRDATAQPRVLPTELTAREATEAHEHRPPEALELHEAIALALDLGRVPADRREALYLVALSVADARHGFSPQIAAALESVLRGGSDLPRATDLGYSAALEQLLPWGGSVGVAVAGEPGAADIGLRWSQPLLRGSGAIAREPLAQAERDLLYAAREYELFREEHAVEVARRYWGLVRQKRSLENLRRNVEGFAHGRRQAEALHRVGRTSELDVLRARRGELQSQDALLGAEEELELALDRFRIFLGLPEERPVDVAVATPEYVLVPFEAETAVAVALENRLDLWTLRDQVADARRHLGQARDELRPRLDLVVEYDAELAGGRADTYGAGLRFALPLDRAREHRAVRSGEVDLSGAQRRVEAFQEDLAASIRGMFRELERRTASLDIQRQLISDQERNVQVARLRFEQGDVSNRDVLEAEEALLEARDGLIREQVEYEVARLELLRAIGIPPFEEARP